MPVLLLAVVIDVRRTKTLQSSQLVLPILAFLIGEINALDIIAFGIIGDGGSGAFATVSASLVSTVVALILAVLADMTIQSDDHAEEENNSRRDSSSVTNTVAGG
jgi:hypothetical protein